MKLKFQNSPTYLPTYLPNASILKLFGYYALITFTLLFTSCERSDISSESLALLANDKTHNVKVVNGELHFTNPESYVEDLKSILAMDEKELDQWEASIGFKSYRSWFNQSADEFFEIKSENEYQNWLNKYSDILYVKDSMVTPILSNNIYDRIVNRTGEFVVGPSYNKVLPDRLIAIHDGNRNLLSEGLKLKVSNEEKGISVLPFQILEDKTIELRNAVTCGRLEITSSHQEGSDRKVYLTATMGVIVLYVPYIGDLYETTVTLDAHGRKKGVFGGWNKYKTDIYVENVSVQAKDNLGNSILAIDDLNRTEEAKKIEIVYLLDDQTGAPYYNSSVPELIWGAGRAKTRGTGSEWTRFCCDQPWWIPCPDLFD